MRRKRRKNPRGKFDRRVAEVKRRGGAYSREAVEKAIESSQRHGPKIGGRERALIHRLLKGRHGNPIGHAMSYIITAQKPGGRVLRYIGHRKFAERGRAVLFANETSARAVLGLLRLEFPSLRSYTMRVHGGR